MSETTNEQTGPALKDATRELADTLKKSLVGDEKNGTVSEPEGITLFEQNLPEGVTMKEVDTVDAYREHFIASGVLAVGEVGVDLLAKNKKLENVTGTLSAGKHINATIDVQRTSTFVNRLNGSNEEITRHGTTKVVVDTRLGTNIGQVKAARLQVRDLGSKLLGGKK